MERGIHLRRLAYVGEGEECGVSGPLAPLETGYWIG